MAMQALTVDALRAHDEATYKTNNDLFHLDPDERKEMEDLFNTYNVSCTGELSLEEFTHLFQDLGLQDVEQAMKILDTEGKGTITKLEFMRWFFQPETMKEGAAAVANARAVAAEKPKEVLPRRQDSATKKSAASIRRIDEFFPKHDRGNKRYLRSEELERFLIDFGLKDSHDRRRAKDLIQGKNGRSTKQDIVNWYFGNSNMVPSASQSRSRPRSVSGVSSYSGAYSSGGTWTGGSKSVATKTTMGDYDMVDRMNRHRKKNPRESSVASGASIQSGITLHNMGADDERARKIFDIIDKNQDGMIDVRDFMAAIERLGLRWDKRHKQRVFGILDVDAMQSVDYDTFCSQLKTDHPSLRCLLNRLLFEVDPEMDMDPDEMVDPSHAGERMDPGKVQKLMQDLKAGWQERVTAIHSLGDHCITIKGDKFHQVFKRNLNGWVSQLTDGRSSVLRECCLALAKVVKNRKKEMQKYLPRLFDAMFALLRTSGVESIRASAHLWFRAVVKYVPDNKKYVLITQILKGTKDPKYPVVRQYCFDYLTMLLNKARVTGRPTDKGWWDKLEGGIKDGVKDNKDQVKQSVYEALVRLEALYPDRAKRIMQRMKPAQVSRFEEKQAAFQMQMSRMGMFANGGGGGGGLASIASKQNSKMRSQLMAFLDTYEDAKTHAIPNRELNKVFKDLGVPNSIIDKKLTKCNELLGTMNGIDVQQLVDWILQDPKLCKIKVPKPGMTRQKSLPRSAPPEIRSESPERRPTSSRNSRPTTPSRKREAPAQRAKQRKPSVTRNRGGARSDSRQLRKRSAPKAARSTTDTRARRGSRGSVASSRSRTRADRGPSSRTFGPRPMPRQNRTPQKKLGPRRPEPRERSPAAKQYDRYATQDGATGRRRTASKGAGRAEKPDPIARQEQQPAKPAEENFGNVLSEILEVRSVLSQVENQIQSISNFTNSFSSTAPKPVEAPRTGKTPPRSEREKKISKAAHRRMNSVRTQVRQVESIVDQCDKGQKGYLTMMEMREFLGKFGVQPDQMSRAMATIQKQQGRARKSTIVQWALNEAPKQDWGRWKEIIGYSDMVAASMPQVAEEPPEQPAFVHQHSREVLLEINNPSSGFPDVPSNGSSPYHSTESNNGLPGVDAQMAGWAMLSPDQLGTRLQFYNALFEEESATSNATAVRELGKKIATIRTLLKERGKDPAQYESNSHPTQHLTEKPGIIKTQLKGAKGKEVKDIIKKLRLVKAKHGGLQAEACRSNEAIIMPRQPKSSGILGNSINYILEGDSLCHWHQIPSDQTWAFHKGCEMVVYTLDARTQQLSTARLGDVLSRNKALCQFHLPAGSYVAAELSEKDDYALISIHNFPAVEPNSVNPVSVTDFSRKFSTQRDLIRLCG